MKRISLSALIGVGFVAAILQILSISEAARTRESYPLVRRGTGTFKTGPPAPTPTPPGGIIYVPLPERPVPPDKLEIVKVNVALASNGGKASASSELDAARRCGCC
jgi:hypothetical protein